MGGPPADPGRGTGDTSNGGPVLGILVIGVFAIAIDWTWDLPAAIAPFVICIGLVSGRALATRGSPFGSELVDPAMGGYEWEQAPPSPSPAVLGLAAAALALAAIGSGAILSFSSIQMGISADRLAEGDLTGAASAARAAAAIEPWSVEPELRLAEIEKAGTNFESARRRAEQAVAASPEDFRGWLLLSEITFALENPSAAANYATRATKLAAEGARAGDGGPRPIAARRLRWRCAPLAGGLS